MARCQHKLLFHHRRAKTPAHRPRRNRRRDLVKPCRQRRASRSLGRKPTHEVGSAERSGLCDQPAQRPHGPRIPDEYATHAAVTEVVDDALAAARHRPRRSHGGCVHSHDVRVRPYGEAEREHGPRTANPQPRHCSQAQPKDSRSGALVVARTVNRFVSNAIRPNLICEMVQLAGIHNPMAERRPNSEIVGRRLPARRPAKDSERASRIRGNTPRCAV